MLHFNKLPPKELHKSETSNMLFEDPERVEPPGESIDVFEEMQPFDQVWLWTLLGLETIEQAFSHGVGKKKERRQGSQRSQ